MRGGTLDNKVLPRIVVVFDGSLGYVPTELAEQFNIHYILREREHAVSLMRLDKLMTAKLLDITRRLEINVDLVTWMEPEYADLISDMMNSYSIPVRSCFPSSPQELARDLAYNPDIVAVYDPDPANMFVYGSKGIYLQNPNQIGMMF